MNKNDVLEMLFVAEEITRAAQRHETILREILNDFEDLPDHSDYAVIGESFSPLSQALSHWRGLMAVMFQPAAVVPAQMAELAATLKEWGCE